MKVCLTLLLVLATALPNLAHAESKCKSPPEFVGVPTGRAALRLGKEVPAGHKAHFNFGETFVVAGDFNGLFAATLWGLDDCGLWIQIGEHESYLNPNKEVALKPPTYVFVEATDGVYRITAELLLEHSEISQVLKLALSGKSGPVFELEQQHSDSFVLRVLVELPFVHSDF